MTPLFRRFASLCAIGTGITGFIYSVAFVAKLPDGVTWGLLLIGGLLTVPVIAALFAHFRDPDNGFALTGAFFGFGSAFGAIAHGGYGLATAIRPSVAIPIPAGAPLVVSLDSPNAIDPRGLAVFGLAGLGVLTWSWLITRDGGLSPRLGYLGYLSAALLVVIYLGRLIIVSSNNPAVVLPAALEGLIVNPAWYLWLGLSLRGARSS